MRKFSRPPYKKSFTKNFKLDYDLRKIKKSARKCFFLKPLIGNFNWRWRFLSVDPVHFNRVELILECGLMSKEIEEGKKLEEMSTRRVGGI